MLRRSPAVYAAAAAAAEAVMRFGRFGIFDESTTARGRAAEGVWRVEMSTSKAHGSSRNNLMDPAFFADLKATFEWLSMDADAEVRACVLHAALPSKADGGKDTHFSCGLDLKAAGPILLKDLPSSQAAKLAVTTTLGMRAPSLSEPGLPAKRNMKIRQLIHQWQESISSVAACRVPVIAAVHGMSLGGAVDLSSACDFRFASAESILSIKEAHVGIVADLGSLQRVGRIVGEGTLREWAYTARDVDATEAERRLYYNRVLATPAECLEHALSVADSIASASSPMAVQGTKYVLNHASETEAQRGLEHVKLWNSAFLKSNDLVEAAVAFAQKRRPRFEGERVVDQRKPLSGKKKARGSAAATAASSDDAAAASTNGETAKRN